jgi:hypothetical protein
MGWNGMGWDGMGSPSLSDQRSCVRVASSTGYRPSAVDTPAANREEKSEGHG